MKDALTFWSQRKSEGTRKAYSFICCYIPKLFDVLYRYEYNHRPANARHTTIYKLLSKGCDTLDKYLKENVYNAVICSHVFGAMMLTELKKQGRCKPKICLVNTDNVCHPGTEQTSMDCSFIPGKELLKDFCMNGVPASKVVPTGIPLTRGFCSKLSKADAKRRLGIDVDRKVILVMGGHGLWPDKAIAIDFRSNCLRIVC